MGKGEKDSVLIESYTSAAVAGVFAVGIADAAGA
jgi:hypothetical protein